MHDDKDSRHTEVVDPRAPKGKDGSEQGRTEIRRPDDPQVGTLTIIDGPGMGHSFAIYRGQNSIGRGEAARVRLDFGDGAISAAQPHALLQSDADGFTVFETGHANRVYVDDEVVTHSRRVASGVRIRIARTTLRFTTG